MAGWKEDVRNKEVIPALAGKTSLTYTERIRDCDARAHKCMQIARYEIETLKEFREDRPQGSFLTRGLRWGLGPGRAATWTARKPADTSKDRRPAG